MRKSALRPDVEYTTRYLTLPTLTMVYTSFVHSVSSVYLQITSMLPC